MTPLSKVALVLLVFYLSFQIASCDVCDAQSDELDDSFEEYLEKYNIVVPDAETREKYREQYIKTQNEVRAFNARLGMSYKQSINRFAHLTFDEVVKDSFGLTMLQFKRESAAQERALSPGCKVAPIDWRKTGAVTAVKQQGTCGNCFIFSAVASIESLTYIKTNKSFVLSEQYVMDCMSRYWKINNNACNGGQPDYAYNLVMSKLGLPLSSAYPYTGIDKRVCPVRTAVKETAIKSFKTFMDIDEDTLVCNLMNGPLSVAICANSSFLRYSSGIYNDVASCGPNMVLNHAALMVGYDRDPVTKMEYYIIKNSWGTDFGEKGYIRMQKGVSLCGITSLVQQPSFDPPISPFALWG